MGVVVGGKGVFVGEHVGLRLTCSAVVSMPPTQSSPAQSQAQHPSAGDWAKPPEGRVRCIHVPARRSPRRRVHWPVPNPQGISHSTNTPAEITTTSPASRASVMGCSTPGRLPFPPLASIATCSSMRARTALGIAVLVHAGPVHITSLFHCSAVGFSSGFSAGQLLAQREPTTTTTTAEIEATQTGPEARLKRGRVWLHRLLNRAQLGRLRIQRAISSHGIARMASCIHPRVRIKVLFLENY
jgi:hypothetical protein